VAPTISQWPQVMNGSVTQQAQIVAYADNFKLMLLTSLPMLLLLLIMRRPKHGQADAGHAVMDWRSRPARGASRQELRREGLRRARGTSRGGMVKPTTRHWH